jgi:hypothetical protein
VKLVHIVGFIKRNTICKFSTGVVDFGPLILRRPALIPVSSDRAWGIWISCLIGGRKRGIINGMV